MSDEGSIRELLEAREVAELARTAAFSLDAVRRRSEPPSDLRTEFQRDRDRIIHTKAFRRLMHKTQVFIAPTGDHYRTRLTHTLEVTQIARTIARALRLNEDLVEAIGMGHDLGHTPFGHAGETALADVLPGFRHNEQSLRIVDKLEKDGEGLNLTEPVRDGILRHSKPNADISGEVSGVPSTLEGHVLKISDGVAYINHDLDDAIRANLIATDDVPPIVFERLGTSHAQRINTLVLDIVRTSKVETDLPEITMSETVREAANALRGFLFERVYTPLNEREDTLRAQHVVRELCAYYLQHPEALPRDRHGDEDDPVERQVADYVASMTDRYAVETFTRLFVPRYWSV